jgi:DnaJ-domain-containing protein 1
MALSGISPSPVCWFCGARISAALAEVESVIESRRAVDGGPFLTLTCRRCRTRCGALRNRRGAWLLYPLEGATAPTIVDRLVPSTGRERLERARAWWLLHADSVERFRAARAATAPDDGVVPRRPPRVNAKASAAPAARPAPPSGPRAVLGVAPDASLGDVRRAWRSAVKRWHPDRIPTADPVVLAEAHLRFQEIRAAYEALVAEMSARPGFAN